MFVLFFDILKLTPVSPRPCEKYFLMFVFVVGHECFSYDNPKINKKDKTGNHALKVFPHSNLYRAPSEGKFTNGRILMTMTVGKTGIGGC